MHLVPDVLIEVLGDPGRGVAELPGHNLYIDARLERQRRSGVPGRVELDHRQPGLRREFAEPAGDVVRVQRLAELVGEHPAGVRPRLTGGQALALQQRPVRPDGFDGAPI